MKSEEGSTKKKEEEERIRAKVKEQEEERLLLAEKYEAKGGQVVKLTSKLEKLWHKYKNASAEVDDLQREFQREREDMLESIRALSKELKLKSLVIDYFIPPEEYQRIADRAQYDQVEDAWEISHIGLAGNAQARRPGSALGLERPAAEFSRVARQHSADPRFRSDGILQTDLLSTERLTRAGEVDPSQAMNNEVLSAIQSGLDENDYVPNTSVYFS
ncbi:kif-3, putative [Perkinsus marinus ATCC 50983]|uniref:Kif-3, putative n=1 Tax=Perkinsus marinus (strain ATCC 50983 / TXsc) TaxID=423536 RepID=C5LQM1_PERM5|nr:kif-3, putative [Perkinsus marinus ATCC 50983]EER00972.1 kif-3, putative [Perkinsus marinus ATCC 50983]|eukprot:XP_002768254.1 kif-3, putative [Perkinsus marinus ATCC 50983]